MTTLADNTLPHAEIIQHVKERTPGGHVLLSFSGGKDAWATWLGIREHFDSTHRASFFMCAQLVRCLSTFFFYVSKVCNLNPEPCTLGEDLPTKLPNNPFSVRQHFFISEPDNFFDIVFIQQPSGS